MKFLSPLLFNFYTKGYIKASGHYFFFLNKRFKSMMTDLLFVLSVFIPVCFVVIVIEIMDDSKAQHVDNQLSTSFFISSLIFGIITFVLLNKDFYNARSVAKRIYGYQIFDSQTKAVASPIQCMIRNVTMIIWPVEAVWVLFTPNRRLGDVIAGTIIIDQPPEPPESILADMENYEGYSGVSSTILLSIIVTSIMLLLANLPLLIKMLPISTRM